MSLSSQCFIYSRENKIVWTDFALWVIKICLKKRCRSTVNRHVLLTAINLNNFRYEYKNLLYFFRSTQCLLHTVYVFSVVNTFPIHGSLFTIEIRRCTLSSKKSKLRYFCLSSITDDIFRCTVYVNNALYRFIDCNDKHLPCRLCLHLIPLGLSCPKTSNPVLLAPFRISMFFVTSLRTQSSIFPWQGRLFSVCKQYETLLLTLQHILPCLQGILREVCRKYSNLLSSPPLIPHPPPPPPRHIGSCTTNLLTLGSSLCMYSYDSLMAKFLCRWKGLGRKEWYRMLKRTLRYFVLSLEIVFQHCKLKLVFYFLRSYFYLLYWINSILDVHFVNEIYPFY
jgi:hypothetical protein